MGTLELDAWLRYASSFLDRTPLVLIDGQFVPAASGKTFEVHNPASGAVIVEDAEFRPCRSDDRLFP